MAGKRGGAGAHGLSLRPFRALSDHKLDLVAFTQGLEACRVGNRRVVDENIRTVVLRDKPEPLLVVKPLHRSMSHGLILLTWGIQACRPTSSEDHKKTAPGFALAGTVP